MRERGIQRQAERRRHPRLPLFTPVRLSTIDPETDPWTGRPVFRSSTEVSGNLSRGGLFVVTSDPLSPGRRVLLELALPGGGRFEALGRVAWCRSSRGEDAPQETGVGIEFAGSPPEQSARLEQVLRARTHPTEAG